MNKKKERKYSSSQSFNFLAQKAHTAFYKDYITFSTATVPWQEFIMSPYEKTWKGRVDGILISFTKTANAAQFDCTHIYPQ